MTVASFVTDTHIGLGFKDKRIYSCLNAYADAMEKLKPDAIIHLGDVFHTKRPAADSIEFATTWFTRLAQCTEAIVVLAGGHDADAKAGITAIDFLDDLAPNITIVLQPQSLGNLLLLPYTRRLTADNFSQILQHSQLFMHQGIAEVPLDNQNRNYGELSDAVPIKYLQHLDLCLVGHMHTPWSSGNIHVIGSPYPTRRGMFSDQRSYPVITLENPKDIKFYDYRKTFCLKKVAIEYDIESKLRKPIIGLLPPKTDDTFYYVDIAVAGPVTQTLYLEIRQIVESVYGKQLDDLSVVSVLPKEQRMAIQRIKSATSKMDESSPHAMLEAWMEEQRRKAYYDANPELKNRVLKEFAEVVSAVS